MKNILAKGGIEFLAVLIGIVLSLWIDDYRNYLVDKEIEKKALVNFSVSLNQDLKYIDWIIRDLKNECTMLDSMIYNFNSLSKDSVASYFDKTNKWLVFTPRISTYETLKRAGQLYKISDLKILEKIISIYDIGYSGIEKMAEEDERNILMLQDYLIEHYDIVPSDIMFIKLRDLGKEYDQLKNDQKYFNYLTVSYQTKIIAIENINGTKKLIVNILSKIDLSIKNMEN